MVAVGSTVNKTSRRQTDRLYLPCALYQQRKNSFWQFKKRKQTKSFSSPLLTRACSAWLQLKQELGIEALAISSAGDELQFIGNSFPGTEKQKEDKA